MDAQERDEELDAKVSNDPEKKAKRVQDARLRADLILDDAAVYLKVSPESLRAAEQRGAISKWKVLEWEDAYNKRYLENKKRKEEAEKDVRRTVGNGKSKQRKQRNDTSVSCDSNDAVDHDDISKALAVIQAVAVENRTLKERLKGLKDLLG